MWWERSQQRVSSSVKTILRQISADLHVPLGDLSPLYVLFAEWTSSYSKGTLAGYVLGAVQDIWNQVLQKQVWVKGVITAISLGWYYEYDHCQAVPPLQSFTPKLFLQGEGTGSGHETASNSPIFHLELCIFNFNQVSKYHPTADVSVPVPQPSLG